MVYSVSFACCLVLSYTSALLMVSVHLTSRMFLRHLLTNTWTGFKDDVVFLKASDPYSSTDFTLVLNILSLVFVLNALLLQTGLWQTLAVPSFSLPGCLCRCPRCANYASLVGEILSVFFFVVIDLHAICLIGVALVCKG